MIPERFKDEWKGNRMTNVLLDGLAFAEGPRWHEGRLWFSDMHAHEVVAVDLEGKRESIVTVPNDPSGLGWLPDGTLVVSALFEAAIHHVDPQGNTTDMKMTVISRSDIPAKSIRGSTVGLP